MAEENLDNAVVAPTGIVETAEIGAPTEAELLSMDPEYQEYVEQEKAEPKLEGEVKPSEDDVSDDDVDETDEPESDESPKEDEEVADEKEVEFDDDILPGLTGEQFKGFDEPVKEIIAKSREDLDKATEQATKAQARLDALLNDPIIKHREEAIAKGQNELLYKVPEVELEDSVVEKMQELIDKDTPESRKELKTLLNNEIATAVKAATEVVADNSKIAAKAEYERQQNIRGASEKVIALAKLLKADLPSNDYKVIANTPIGDLGQIGVALKDLELRAKKGLIGNVQKYLAETDVEELYASMAIKNKWPLLKNADKLISKQIKDSNRKFYERFVKGKPDEASGSFARGGSIDQKASSQKTVRDGVDLVKLATDEKYHETILYSKQNDSGWADKVAVLRNEGERMIEENPRLHAPRGNK